MAEFIPLLSLLAVVVFLGLTLLIKGKSGGPGESRGNKSTNIFNKSGGSKAIGSRIFGYLIKRLSKREKEKKPTPKDPPLFDKGMIEPVFPDKDDAYQMLKQYKSLRRLVELAIVQLDDLENPKFWENHAIEVVKTGDTKKFQYAPTVKKAFDPIRKFLSEYRE